MTKKVNWGNRADEVRETRQIKECEPRIRPPYFSHGRTAQNSLARDLEILQYIERVYISHSAEFQGASSTVEVRRPVTRSPVLKEG